MPFSSIVCKTKSIEPKLQRFTKPLRFFQNLDLKYYKKLLVKPLVQVCNLHQNVLKRRNVTVRVANSNEHTTYQKIYQRLLSSQERSCMVGISRYTKLGAQMSLKAYPKTYKNGITMNITYCFSVKPVGFGIGSKKELAILSTVVNCAFNRCASHPKVSENRA